jgi:hypothetical protein
MKASKTKGFLVSQTLQDESTPLDHCTLMVNSERTGDKM